MVSIASENVLSEHLSSHFNVTLMRTLKFSEVLSKPKVHATDIDRVLFSSPIEEVS